MPTSRMRLAALALLAGCGLVQAQEEAGKPPRIFTTDQAITATLEAPWSKISRYKESDDTWPGTFSYTGATGPVSIPVTISTRGLTRLRVCDFPPLRIEFDQEAVKGTEFRGAGNLKMVTHCLANSRFEQYYIKEYLSYRIYNLVTPLSFRVQGLDMSYDNSERGGNPIKRFAFLIEDPDDVAKRNGMQKLEIPEATPARLDPVTTSRFMLFQYLISNLDWSVLSGPKSYCCHNARLLGSADDTRVLYPVPYDLDSSGLVDAHYAAPPDKLPVRNVTQRLYRGFCAHNAAVPQAVAEFQQLRPQIMALFENDPRLDSRNRNGAVKFINRFYAIVDEPREVQEELIDNCRG